MEVYTINEEMQYCTSCGAANKKSAVYCNECKKKIRQKHSPFIEFIKKRVKNKFVSDATQSVFSLIKDFLLSHLYGVVLTVSVITTGAVALADSTPYIKTVTAPPATINSVAEQEESTESEYGDFELEAIYAANNIMIDYGDHIFAKNYAYDGVTLDPATLPLSSFYAENNVTGFSFPGVHDMMTKSIPLGIYDNSGASHVVNNQGFREGSYIFNENVVSSTGKALYENGFDVMECIYDYSFFLGFVEEDEPLDNAAELETYRMVFVKSGDNWYLAEDRLERRIEGESYSIYSQYGPYGYVTQ